MTASNAPKQVKALSQCAANMTLGRFTNLGSHMNALNKTLKGTIKYLNESEKTCS